jgi:hypothetical protein
MTQPRSTPRPPSAAEKLNAAAELGYRVLRFTPRMVEDGSALAQIQRILSKLENTDAA